MTRLLWIGRERTIESFQGFVNVIGDELASKIDFVCSHMWQPYLNVMREKCSQALHILDRFHIVAKMTLSRYASGSSVKMYRIAQRWTDYCTQQEARRQVAAEQSRLNSSFRSSFPRSSASAGVSRM